MFTALHALHATRSMKFAAVGLSWSDQRLHGSCYWSLASKTHFFWKNYVVETMNGLYLRLNYNCKIF